MLIHSSDGCIWQYSDWLCKGSLGAIENGLYRQFGIGGIVGVAVEHFPATRPADVPYVLCGFRDEGEDLTHELLGTIDSHVSHWKDLGVRVLVHCFGGRNRSTAICAWLLHLLDGWTPEQISERMIFGNCNAGVRAELVQKLLQLTGLDIAALTEGRVQI